ncbi:hypothetical protein HK097_002720, partial [Rhizophlyctis rosea]
MAPKTFILPLLLATSINAAFWETSVNYSDGECKTPATSLSWTFSPDPYTCDSTRNLGCMGNGLSANCFYNTTNPAGPDNIDFFPTTVQSNTTSSPWIVYAQYIDAECKTPSLGRIQAHHASDVCDGRKTTGGGRAAPTDWGMKFVCNADDTIELWGVVSGKCDSTCTCDAAGMFKAKAGECVQSGVYWVKATCVAPANGWFTPSSLSVNAPKPSPSSTPAGDTSTNGTGSANANSKSDGVGRMAGATLT